MSAQPLEVRMAHLEGGFEQLGKRIENLERKVDSMRDVLDAKIDAVRDSLNAKFDTKIDGLQWRMTALIIGTWITTMLAVLFHH
jgi:predicted RNase H-like nuclease (RuvC/YqgF family)